MSGAPKSAEGIYSFCVNSDPTMSSDSPLRLENPNLAKQKRRRTSPRDHAILEAAYLRNSKPDKHERAEIVSQVELGEKEVQIWFQNRRQNDRRKSKPLQPHELLAHFRNGVPLHGIQQGDNDDEDAPSTIENLVPASLDVPRPASRSSSIHELLNPTSSVGSSTLRDDKTRKIQTKDPLPTPPSSFESGKQQLNDVPSTTHYQPSRTDGASHSRKRSHEVMSSEAQSTQDVPSVEGPAPLLHAKTLTRSSSFVRLAMTVDGAVKVRTNEEPTPSPPKQRLPPPSIPAKKRESFGRSQSAIENGFVFKDVNPPTRKVGGAGFGRSRDARTWEFYCDRDSGDALSTQAEAERSGSAIGAINLIRSRSQRSRFPGLIPNPTKHNGRPVYVDQNQAKPKPKLARTMSSMARLQSFDGVTEITEKDNKRAKHNRSPSGDSDKENWAPGTRTSHHSMRRVHASTSRNSILQENDFPSARDPVSNNISQAQENRDVIGKEKAKGDDLDCIKGLLSLSQGAWR